MSILRILSTAAVLSLLTACASVEGLLGRDAGFSELDTNGDGVISAREAAEVQSLADAFERVDTNGDQNINREEFRAATTLLAPRDFDRLDLNGDGVVSAREAEAARPSIAEVFDAVDADGDGNVSQTEYQAGTLNLLRNVEFEVIDRDGDGVIDNQEAKRHPIVADRFDDIDIDGDNLVAPNEFRWAQGQ